MTKLSHGLWMAATVSLSSTLAQGAVLNLPYEAAYRYGDSCNYTEQGGARTSLESPTYCWLAIALPIEAGRTIKQITVYYGTEGAGPSSIRAFLGYKDLRSVSVTSGFNGIHLAEWESTDDVVADGMASANLMEQAGAYPFVSYPDAFVVSTSRAYFVRVTLGEQSEFFGLRVLYE